MSRSLLRPALGGAVALLLLVSACGGDDGDSPAMGDTTDQVADDTATDDTTASEDVSVPDDICALVSAADVGAVLGETVEARDVPGGGCQYAGGTSASLYPTIVVAEDVPGAGGIDGARQGAEGAVSGTAEDLTVAGFDGYVVSGSIGSSTSTQGSLAVNGLIVTVTVSGGDAASNADVVTQLLELTITALDA